MLQVSLLDTESKKKLRWIQCKCFCFKFSDFREVIDVYSTSDQPYPSLEYIGKKEKKKQSTCREEPENDHEFSARRKLSQSRGHIGFLRETWKVPLDIAPYYIFKKGRRKENKPWLEPTHHTRCAYGWEKCSHWCKGLRLRYSEYRAEGKSRDIKENRGMAVEKHFSAGGEGTPDVCQPPVASFPGELWLPPPGNTSFSSYPSVRATFLFYFSILKFSSFPSCKFIDFNSFTSFLLKKFGN